MSSCFHTFSTILLILILEIGHPVGADAHGMKSDLHLVGIFIIHVGAQLIIRHEAVVSVAERVKHGAVFGTQLAEVHEQTHGSAHKKADQQIERAEDNNDGHDDRAYHQTGADGDNGVPLGADGDQVRLGRVHGRNQGKSGAEVKKKLS